MVALPCSPAPALSSAKPAEVVELMPGEVALGLSGTQFKTLLGSCVSVVLTDPRRTVGSMCHIVHVGAPNAQNRHNPAYGVVAMHDMFTRLRALGVNPRMCQAFVYGGGNMFPQIISSRPVGESNAQWVFDYLTHHGIAVVDQCVGGNGYRKVSWTVGSQDPVVETVFPEQGVAHGG